MRRECRTNDIHKESERKNLETWSDHLRDVNVKWEDNIKEMVHASKGTQSIYLPKDRDQWRYPVNGGDLPKI